MVIYKKEFLQITYHSDNKLITTTWIGFPSSETYREALEQMLELMQQHDIVYWLGDHREARVVRANDQTWVMQNWWPRFLKQCTGIKRIARVNAKDISAKISANNMSLEIDHASMPCLLQAFDDYAQARAWLLEKSEN